jgi:hypothetical protein
MGVQLLYASHVCRVMSMVSCTVNPEPMFSPKVRLRESGDWHVATRSPTPAKPWNVSPQRHSESRHFGQAAGDQGRLRILSQAHTHGHAVGDRDHVFH